MSRQSTPSPPCWRREKTVGNDKEVQSTEEFFLENEGMEDWVEVPGEIDGFEKDTMGNKCQNIVCYHPCPLCHGKVKSTMKIYGPDEVPRFFIHKDNAETLNNGDAVKEE